VRICSGRNASQLTTNDLDAGYETTFLEPPETPAHQFAVKAFKHAIFGTPAPAEAGTSDKKLQTKQPPTTRGTRVPEIAAPHENGPPLSPSKQPGGILRTPMTANKAQKSVSFGAQVLDNEGKRLNASKSEIPNDCPGKFPSPWTPGTELKADAQSEKRIQSKLTTALLEARTTPQLKPSQTGKARDDSDITMDLGAPRSESGRYWRDRYESYAEKSEKEVKKLVAKQQLAKNYARKKDGEVTELVTKLEQEGKRYRRRESELETQNKDLQERLRKALAETSASSVEIAALKSRVATLEQSMTAPSSEVEASKPSFQIYEDSSKAAIKSSSEPDAGIEASYLSQKSRALPVGKENSPPKYRRVRRQTLPDASTYAPTPRLGVEAGQVSTILAKPSRPSSRGRDAASKPTVEQELASKSYTNERKAEIATAKILPKSPAAFAPSSPLPVPSPGLEDPWMLGADESSIAQADKFALPILSGPSISRPLAGTRRLHRSVKPTSQVTGTGDSRPVRKTETRVSNTTKTNTVEPTSNVEKVTSRAEKPAALPLSEPEEVAAVDSSSFDAAVPSPTDPKFDLSKMTTHHAEGSSQVKRDRVQFDAERKAEAKRRLLEKKQRKQSAK
jgi:hypothetical protein